MSIFCLFDGVIRAQRFFSKKIPCRLKRPRPASSTNSQILTPAALSFVQGKISQFAEYIRLFPHFPETILSNIPALQFQVPARLHNAVMGDETKSRSS
jgi:hypothetical protein